MKLTDIMFSPTALKKVFAQNKEIQEMAQNNFIMLNLMVHDLYNVFLISQFGGKAESLFLSFFKDKKSYKVLVDIECYIEL